MVVPGPNGNVEQATAAGNGCLPTTPQSPATKDKSDTTAEKNKVRVAIGRDGAMNNFVTNFKTSKTVI